jgi:hypothetical protein
MIYSRILNRGNRFFFIIITAMSWINNGPLNLLMDRLTKCDIFGMTDRGIIFRILAPLSYFCLVEKSSCQPPSQKRHLQFHYLKYSNEANWTYEPRHIFHSKS